MIDHRGLLSLDPFTKGLELTALKGNGPVICFAREDYRVITPSESRVLEITPVLKTRKYLASRITFRDWKMTCFPCCSIFRFTKSKYFLKNFKQSQIFNKFIKFL